MHRAAIGTATAIGLILSVGGCGDSTTIRGRVTYADQDIAKGSISFLPADGKGPTVGAPIAEGRYQLRGAVPGKKIVQIVAVKDVPFARSSEEMEKMSQSAAARGDKSGVIDRADVLPPNAEGNNAPVEIKPGAQELDFHLQPPVKK